MTDLNPYADDALHHLFLLVEAQDATCMLNLAGHPLRIREVVFQMVDNGCRVSKVEADFYNTFLYDKEVTEIYDYLTTIIKVKFVKV
ncbi:hypothetical protein ACD591_08495 [Rufibacter glacialis]|uniref:Uncharacterized protein n=1 Tax=Rufibacter glacialis TaxID=1259555 RepID=A0A5M8QC99_9BACT|nr:hypothetical protein [Rufibacter glacialis]KAA6432520.1 hypothetical protein FOE74_15610 [Rufibacter glacialis]GGK79416.1 hypothetical protein GCM10011405_29070 [Rufibacter glacialis]